jgi:dethiobiotin synthetase
MKQTFFITGTDTGVGKTVLTVLLAQFLRERGVNAAALKPICSGGRGDAKKIFAAMSGAFEVQNPKSKVQSLLLSLDEINPWHFRAPIAPLLSARKENKRVKLSQVLAHARTMQKRFDILLIEGAGGLLSPLGVCSGGLRPSQSSALTERRYKENFDSRDLILALRAIPIIVAQNKLGVVNQVLLTLEALPKNLRAKTRVVLMSPSKPDVSTKTNAKLLAEFAKTKKIFQLPWLGKNAGTIRILKNLRVRRTLGLLASGI